MDLFTYGTLMVREVMQRVSGYAAPGEAAALQGFRRRLLRGEVYPGIVPWPGEWVTGILYRDLTEQQLTRLDDFEGAMYQRRQVWLNVDGQRVAAATYVLVPAWHDLLGETDWALEDFLESGLQCFLSDYPGFDRNEAGGGGANA